VTQETWDPPTEDELAALDALGPKKGEWVLQGRTLALTNLDKVLFPARGDDPPVTKRDLIRYHALIAPHMLPYLQGRAVNSNRFPQGVDKPGFWHKAVPSHAPEWMATWDYPRARTGETRTYFVVDSPPALAWLANYGSIELNPWNSRTGTSQEPAWAYIDLDPGRDTTWEDLVQLAVLHRAALEQLEVRAAAKVTGKRGIQIWIPVAPGYGFDDTRDWVEALSRAVGRVVPDLVSWAWAKRERGGRARLDFTQNAVNKTLVAPFSARPAAGAPVSVPIAWDELDDPDLAPDRWTIRTALDHVEAVGDPLRELIDLPQELPELG
jgi:bifunctional non-homologous end joining protein LigD